MLFRHCSSPAFLLGVGIQLLASSACAQASSDLILVSPFEDGTHVDLQIDASGRAHAVWLAEPVDALFPDLFYGSSPDGLAWSEPVRIVEGTPSDPLGIPQLVLDEAGRLYAFWTVLATGISGMGTEEMPDSPTFVTLQYRVLEDGRWSPVIQVGTARSVLSWSASVGETGRVALLWSEIPTAANIMTSKEEATVIRVADVSGTALGTVRTVLDGGATGGYWGVGGYVDDRGDAHGVALKGFDSPVLVRFDGTRETPWFEAGEMLRGYNGHRLPKLVRDQAGGEHLLLYNGHDTDAAILDYDGAGESRIVIRAGGGRILSYRVTRGRRGSILVTAAVQPAGGQTADLYVAEYVGGRWTEPRNVTDNGARAGAGGVWDTRGTTYGTTSTWNAVGGAAAFDPAGRVGVLLTNRMSGGAGTDQQTIGSREYVYFAWVDEGSGAVLDTPTASTPAPTPVTERPVGPSGVPAPRPAPSPAAAGDAPDPAGLPSPAGERPTAEPDPPTPATAGGLPNGTYACHYLSPYAGPIPTGESIVILPGGSYRDLEGDTGTYELRSGTVRWISGSLATASPAPEFYMGEAGRPTVEVIRPGSAGEPSYTLYCVLR